MSSRKWGTGPAGVIEQTRRDRIVVSVAAYAYENRYQPIMSDADYDALSERVHIERNIATGNHRLDRFFQRNFQPDTGLWIHKHPDLPGIINIYARWYHVPKKRRRRKKR